LWWNINNPLALKAQSICSIVFVRRLHGHRVFQEQVMKRYESEALMVMHQQAEGLHRLGIISDAEMKEYDKDCLIQEPETPKEAENPQKIEHVTA
jgi:hypothetical protein